MPFLKSLPDNAGPASVFTKYPEIYELWAQMSQTLMYGPSPMSEGERELILAYAAGVAGCKFVYGAHSEVAYAWGIKSGTLDRLLEDLDTAPVEARFKPLLAFVRKLMVTPGQMTQADADAVFSAGWSEEALQGAIAVTARAAFMQRLVEGHGFTPMPHDVAVKRAKERVERGYVNLYPAFRKDK